MFGIYIVHIIFHASIVISFKEVHKHNCFSLRNNKVLTILQVIEIAV